MFSNVINFGEWGKLGKLGTKTIIITAAITKTRTKTRTKSRNREDMMCLPIEKFYPLLFACVSTIIFILVLNPLALRFGLLDKPDNERKLHTHASPLTGGVAMMLGFGLVM